MSAPTKGGTTPSTVAAPTSQGSSIRRLASLKTQYPTASQKTMSRKIPAFRATDDAPDPKKKSCRLSKKSESPLAARIISSLLSLVIGEVDRRRSRRQTRARRSPGRRPRRTRRRSAVRQLSSPFAVFLSLVEVRQQVERARHENPFTEDAGAGERLLRIGNRLDVVEAASGLRRHVVGGERPRIARARRDERPSDPREAVEQRAHPLVREDRDAENVVPRG